MAKKDGSETWSFTYDANGMRTSRTKGSKTYEYVYNGGQLTGMVMKSGTSVSNTLRISYDSGKPMFLKLNGVTYQYVTNVQGDVIAILDADGKSVVEYTYDAWGNILDIEGSKASDLGVINPLRYRGYVYDQETGLYYLQSRYYNPTWGRFINADNYPTTGQGLLGNNMFAYCNNNPTLYCDQEGKSATIAGAICGGIFGAINAWVSGGTAEEILECTLIGAATGAAAGFIADLSVATCGAGTAIILSAVAGGVCSAANSAGSQAILNEGKVNWGRVAYDGAIGAAMGGLCTAVGNVMKPAASGLREGIKYVNAQVAAETTMLTTGKVTSQFLFDVGASAVTGFGAWAFGMPWDYYQSG